jgi:Ca-activated chloride channel homolog
MWDWLDFRWFTWTQLKAFNWVTPYYLYGIVLIPILFWLRVSFHARASQYLSITLPNPGAYKSFSARFRWLYPVTVFLAITMVIIALARPQIIKNIKEIDAEVIDIMLAIDISDSMRETDFLPTRLEAAKAVAHNFINGRLQDRIGLVVFAGEAFTVCPLTDDYEMLGSFLNEINHKQINTTGTAIGNALAVCINRLRESVIKSKVIILLSDGENTAGTIAPILAAQISKAYNIKIYTIALVSSSFGKTATDSISRNIAFNQMDDTQLKNISKASGGLFFRANDMDALQAIFKEINQLEKIKIKKIDYQEITDFYRIYLNWAIVMILCALFLKAILVANVLED